MFESYRHNKKNKFLYYSVGDQRFESDLKAYQHFTKNLNNEISFNLDLRVMDSDWTQEPTQSLQYYRNKMCQAIEQSYDQITLGYSGGTDSETILEAFAQRQTRDLELLNIINTHQQQTKNRQWLREHTEKAVANKWQTTAKKLKWKFNMWQAWQSLDHKEYEKALTDYKYGAWTVDWRYLNSWAQNSGMVTHTRNKSKTSCLVMGKEKPEIVIEDGWWCFKLLNLNWEMPFDCVDPNVDLVFFWINDMVPELIIKLAHLKAKEMETIFKEEQMKPTNENSQKHSQYISKHYERLNRAMGFDAITKFLNSDAQKTFGWFKQEELKEQKTVANEVKKIEIVNQYFDQVAVKTVDNRFLDMERKNLHGVWSKSKKLFPVCQELKDLLT